MTYPLFAVYKPDLHGLDADVQVRPLQPDDIERCAKLATEQVGLEIDIWRNSFEQNLKEERRQTLVALQDGHVVGYASTAWMNPVESGGASAPQGWYLTGVVVDPDVRRRGVGRRLTEARLRWLANRTDRVWYFASAQNRPSVDLHASLGFREVTRDFSISGVNFSGGMGILSVKDDTFEV